MMQRYATENRICCEVVFSPRDTEKQYPHGYGIPKTLIAGVSLADCEQNAKALEDAEFFVLTLIPVRLYLTDRAAGRKAPRKKADKKALASQLPLFTPIA